MNTKSTIKKAFVKTIPIMAGYLVLGAGFGILLQSKGFGLPWALASSLFIYAGSMQYLTIDLLTGGAGLVSAAVTALMVNARHIFYGISMVSECGQGVPPLPQSECWLFIVFGAFRFRHPSIGCPNFWRPPSRLFFILSSAIRF